MKSGLFYGQPRRQESVSPPVKRERRVIDRQRQAARLRALHRAAGVARRVKRGDEPDAVLVELAREVRQEEYEATLRVLSSAPSGVPRVLRELLTEQPAPVAPAQS